MKVSCQRILLLALIAAVQYSYAFEFTNKDENSSNVYRITEQYSVGTCKDRDSCFKSDLAQDQSASGHYTDPYYNCTQQSDACLIFTIDNLSNKSPNKSPCTFTIPANQIVSITGDPTLNPSMCNQLNKSCNASYDCQR